MVARFVTGDLHFFHKNIIRYTHRPFRDVPEMNRALEERWNERIQPRDEVYVLGDFAFTKEREYEVTTLFKRLHGKKTLIKGNHDLGLVLTLGWEAVLRDVEVDGVTLVHDGDHYLRTHPLAADQPIFCANVHEIWKVRGNLLNCGVDVWHFYPVPWDTAREYWQHRFDYWKARQEPKKEQWQIDMEREHGEIRPLGVEDLSEESAHREYLYKLNRLRSGFGLNQQELAQLLGVTPESIRKWIREGGISANIREAIDGYLSLLQRLETYLKPGLLPTALRRSSRSLGGRRPVELLLAQEGEGILLDYFERLTTYEDKGHGL